MWVPILRKGYHLVALPIEEKFPFTECPFLSSFYYNRYIPMIVLCSENYKVVALLGGYPAKFCSALIPAAAKICPCTRDDHKGNHG